jgi:hypothetical protein
MALMYVHGMVLLLIATRIRAELPEFDSWHGQSFFLFIESSSAVGPTKSPVEWVPGALFVAGA